jgi:hypothetical protein
MVRFSELRPDIGSEDGAPQQGGEPPPGLVVGALTAQSVARYLTLRWPAVLGVIHGGAPPLPSPKKFQRSTNP